MSSPSFFFLFIRIRLYLPTVSANISNGKQQNSSNSSPSRSLRTVILLKNVAKYHQLIKVHVVVSVEIERSYVLNTGIIEREPPRRYAIISLLNFVTISSGNYENTYFDIMSFVIGKRNAGGLDAQKSREVHKAVSQLLEHKIGD